VCHTCVVDLESRQYGGWDLSTRILLVESTKLLRGRVQDPELGCCNHIIAAVLTLAAVGVRHDDSSFLNMLTWNHLQAREREYTGV
jgi:hypothetical protein